MRIDTRDMTSGSLWKKLLVFSLPLMLSNLLQVMFNMSDIAVVGRFAGAEALGSVGSTAILVSLFVGFLIGIGGGINSVVARYIGAKDDKNTEKTVHTAAIISLIVGALLLVLGVLFSRGLLELLNTKDELIDGAELYLKIYFLGMPAMAVYNFGSAVFSAAGDTKKPLAFLFAAGIINVILNLFFVIVCKMSVRGVALASVISQYISAVLILVSLFRSKEAYRLRLTSAKLDFGSAKIIVALGIPSGLQNSIFAIANLFIQGAVNSFDAVIVEGNSAAANADTLVYDVMAAFYIAGSSFISQNYGAGKKDRILKSYFISIVYSFITGALLGTAFIFFGREFLSIFATEPEIIEAGMVKLRIMGMSYAVSAFMDSAIAASRGLGKSFVPTVIVILGSCVFRVIWVYTVFAYFGTITSLYLLYIFSWSLTAAAEIIYFFRFYKKQTAEMKT